MRHLMTRIASQGILLACIIGLATATASLTAPPQPSLVLLGDHVARELDGVGVRTGQDDGALSVRVVGDYECTACADFERRAGATLRRWADQGKIQFQLVQSPLQGHRRARKAAVALYCAEAAGNPWGMHLALVDGHRTWGWGPDPTDSFVGYARAAGIETAPFRQCLETDAVKARLAMDIAAAASIGVTGVPVILVGSTLVRPSRSFVEVLDYVEERLEERF